MRLALLWLGILVAPVATRMVAVLISGLGRFRAGAVASLVCAAGVAVAFGRHIVTDGVTGPDGVGWTYTAATAWWTLWHLFWARDFAAKASRPP